MVIDKLSHIQFYRFFEEDETAAILAFIERCKEEQLEDGRYDLYPDRLFALVQTYMTRSKSDSKMETHKINADLQVILKGKEMVVWSDIELLTLAENHINTQDFALYDISHEQGVFCLEEGMFAFFAPWDGHAPSIVCNGEHEMLVKKIVFKFKL